MLKVALILSCYYRASYGRNPEEHPRTCIFAGTTNDTIVLTDPTGGRRYIPIKCNKRNIRDPVTTTNQDKIAEIRYDCDQLWAEMMHYRSVGFNYIKLDDETESWINLQREWYTEDDPRIGLIQQWLI